MSEDSARWYADGLNFTCTRCGNCCTGFPGTVTVGDGEIAALARRLDVGVETFRRRYTRVMSDGSISLRERSNYDCVFYGHEQGCLVYEDRPTQCRTWPFWRSNVRAQRSWDREARSCPGMNRGRLYSIEEIEEQAAQTP